MSENVTPVEPVAEKPKRRRISIWLVVGALLALVVILYYALGIRFFVNTGQYAIQDVVLSSGLKDGQPVDEKTVFKPSDTIICTVTTTGADGGVIGMRWYAGDTVIYEQAGKTQNHTISTAVQSNRSAVLTEGKYHVDIYVTDAPLRTVNFEVKVYHPAISPPAPTPIGHQSIELPWFVEAPFAFDEIWRIDGADWKINEVKVMLMDETQDYFVAVVVNTDMKNLGALSEDQAKAVALPIARYALDNGYVDRARKLKFDGKSYGLDRLIFVNLINPSDIRSYRVNLSVDELK